MKEDFNKIVEAAEKYSDTVIGNIATSFVSGAMSNEAKEYWQQGMISIEDAKEVTKDENYWKLYWETYRKDYFKDNLYTADEVRNLLDQAYSFRFKSEHKNVCNNTELYTDKEVKDLIYLYLASNTFFKYHMSLQLYIDKWFEENKKK